MDQAIISVVRKLQMVNTSDHNSVVSINIFVALLCASIVIGHLLEESRWMNESITALLIVSSLSFTCFFLVNFYTMKKVTKLMSF